MPLFKVTFSRAIQQVCVIELEAENQVVAEEVAGLMDDPEDSAWITNKILHSEVASVIECCEKCNTPYSQESIDGGRCLGFNEDGFCGTMICAIIINKVVK